MTNRYTKQDVVLRKGLPAVNVKVRKFPSATAFLNHHDKTTKSSYIEDWTSEEERAEKALDIALEATQEFFWDYWHMPESEYFPGHTVSARPNGRSGGWLVVKGLPDFDTWDAIMLNKWRQFEKDVRSDVDYLTSDEVMFDSIDANDWFEE